MPTSILTKRGTDIDSRFRSLLQKAVRRGNVELVYTTSALIQSLSFREKNWFRNRSAIITFEECWPLGAELLFNKKFHSKAAALIKVARSVKARDATGLGYLAYRLFEGDRSVLDGGADDRHIKIIADAIRRPDDFWQWLGREPVDGDRGHLVANALTFKSAGRPRDRAVIQAAAYLAASGELPEIGAAAAEEKPFPYWIAFDRHTPQGQRVLNDLARDLHVGLKQLEWTLFYFEGGLANAAAPSRWWDRNCYWRFFRLGLPVEEAHLLWEPIRPQMIQALADDSRRLHHEIYTWKLANRESIETLKKQIELFTTHFETGQIDQLELF
ncbi:MAG: hypothetical protein WAM73_20630 [Desulfobacterales bacterium]